MNIITKTDAQNYTGDLDRIIQEDLEQLLINKLYDVEELSVDSNIDDYNNQVLGFVLEFAESITQVEKLEMKIIKHAKVKIVGRGVDVSLQVKNETPEARPFFRSYRVPFGSWKISSKNKVEIKAHLDLVNYEEQRSKFIRKETQNHI